MEKDRSALACLRKNLDALGIAAEAVIVNQPAESVSLRPPQADGFGLVFVDPPYRLSEDLSDGSPAGRVFAGLGTESPRCPRPWYCGGTATNVGSRRPRLADG